MQAFILCNELLKFCLHTVFISPVLTYLFTMAVEMTNETTVNTVIGKFFGFGGCAICTD